LLLSALFFGMHGKQADAVEPAVRGSKVRLTSAALIQHPSLCNYRNEK
jgi:hypothetical protein